MRRFVLPLVGPLCALAVLLVVNQAVLFRSEQFAFRDSSQYYYPLHQRVQQEWRAGRLPLWDPWQNGGQPLLGNPTAAVLYPGKLIFAVLPDAWAARIYVIAHQALAFAGMLALARSLGISRNGAALAGIGYAFGAPVLFQYSNVIYLVGAAWLPWGLREVDRLVRQTQALAVSGLAFVLAMQTLGGDPQTAYVTLLAGAGYAAGLALRDQFTANLARFKVPIGLGLVAVWVVATLVMAVVRPVVPGWMGSVWTVPVFGWGVWRWRQGRRGPFLASLGGLAGAAVLALALASAQLVPIAEFSALSSRAAGSEPASVFKFSIEPYRLVECLWPQPFGQEYPANRSWLQAIAPAGDRQMWEPSLYLGGLVLGLALIGAGVRGGQGWRPWLPAVALISLLAAFGRFGGPLWWLRGFSAFRAILGPHDPILNQVRTDEFVYDGVGSVYAMLSAWLPGFGLFRYPAKLFTFTAAAVAVLAGAGWDVVSAERSKKTWFARFCLIGLVASTGGWVLASSMSGQAIAFLSDRVPILGIAGPPDVAAAWAETRRSLAHGTFLYTAGFILSLASRRLNGKAWLGPALLVVTTIDLATAGARLIWTAPQALFDAPSEVARQIAEAERADPSPGPFRIHRLSSWVPEHFLEPGSPAKARERLAWERDTLHPLHALPLDLPYCVVKGAIEQEEILDFFRPRMISASPDAARALNVRIGDPICYYPRRSIDLWGARYLILPGFSDDWSREDRGFASFAFQSEVVWPRLTASERINWNRREDWQLVRNPAAYPRAWLVHGARIVAPATDLASRDSLIRQMVYQNDPIWSDTGRPVFNPRELAWIESADPSALRGFIAPVAVEPGESVAVTRYEPGRVELAAELHRPGLVILADTFYPGWRLTIDGVPAPIFRANRLMRAAALTAGHHRLIYTYDPWSFRIGLMVSAFGFAFLLVVTLRAWQRSSTG